MGSGSQGENGVTYNRQLVGHSNFKRHNPRSDRFEAQKFDHVEFWCGDATTTSKRHVFPNLDDLTNVPKRLNVLLSPS